MRSLVRNFLLAPVLMATAALMTHTATAQRVQVPFNFSAAGKLLPAGPYLVQKNAQSGIVMLRSINAPIALIWAISPGDPAPTDSRILLTFDVLGDNYLLRSVQYKNLITARLDKPGKRMEYASLKVLSAR
jgi:hypothetical protein